MCSLRTRFNRTHQIPLTKYFVSHTIHMKTCTRDSVEHRYYNGAENFLIWVHWNALLLMGGYSYLLLESSYVVASKFNFCVSVLTTSVSLVLLNESHCHTCLWLDIGVPFTHVHHNIILVQLYLSWLVILKSNTDDYVDCELVDPILSIRCLPKWRYNMVVLILATQTETIHYDIWPDHNIIRFAWS